jgi:hypothetical protein
LNKVGREWQSVKKFNGTQIMNQEFNTNTSFWRGTVTIITKSPQEHEKYTTLMLSSTHIMFCVFYDHEDRTLQSVHLAVQ